MLGYSEPTQEINIPGVLSPNVLAQRVADAMEIETFMILPHPDVAEHMIFKTSHYKKWLIAMRNLRATIIAKLGNTKLTEMHKLI